MKTVGFSLCYWDDAVMASNLKESLQAWKQTMTDLFHPTNLLLASGTYSDPKLCPVDGITVVNSGFLKTHPYDIYYYHYALCALSAAIWYVIIHELDYDFVVMYDQDTILGNIDFDDLAKKFMDRPEIIMCPAWMSWPDFSLCFWKPEGVRHFAHCRLRANIIQKPQSLLPYLSEEEACHMYRGSWWNPWPDAKQIRQDYGPNPHALERNELAKSWPMVRLPSPATREYFKTHFTPKPIQPEHEPKAAQIDGGITPATTPEGNLSPDA